MAPYLSSAGPSQSQYSDSITASLTKRSHETMSRSAILIQRETYGKICAGKLISGQVTTIDCSMETSDHGDDFPRPVDDDDWDPGWSIAAGVLLVLFLGGLLLWVYKGKSSYSMLLVG